MFDKYLYALGRGVRGAKKALDQAAATPDPAEAARDVTPPPPPPPIPPALPRSPLVLGLRPLVMGIVNVTPDSFSDGGLYLDQQAAVADIMHHGSYLFEPEVDAMRYSLGSITGQKQRIASTAGKKHKNANFRLRQVLLIRVHNEPEDMKQEWEEKQKR